MLGFVSARQAGELHVTDDGQVFLDVMAQVPLGDLQVVANLGMQSPYHRNYFVVLKGCV